MADPLAIDPLSLDPLAGFGVKKRKKPKIDPATEQAIIDRLLETGMGGVELAANVLDTPGSIARGLLAGDPGRAFGGVFDPEQRVTGRELGQQYGLLGKNQPGLDWGDVGGFGLEVLTDPLTYTGIGLLTKGGQAAKAGGTLSKGIVNQIANGERSLLSFGLPLTQGAEFTGQAAAKTAEGIGAAARKPFDATDNLLGLLGYDKPIANTAEKTGRLARSLFDQRVMGRLDPREQDLAEGIFDRGYRTEKAYTEQSRNAAMTLDAAHAQVKQIDPNIDRGQFERVARFAAEAGADDAVDDLFPGQDWMKPILRNAAGALKNDIDGAYNRFKDLGGKIGEVDRHFPRGVRAEGETGGATTRGYSFTGATSRRPALREVPADIVQRIADDPMARGQGGAAHIENAYSKWLDPLYGATPQNPAGLGIAGHAKALAKWTRKRATSGAAGPVFDQGVVENTAGYLKGVHTATANIEAAQEFILKNATAGGPGVKLGSLYQRAHGFDANGALDYAARTLGITVADAKKLTVPQDVADAVVNVLKPLDKTSGWGEALLKGVDSINDITRRYLTLPFPKFHLRNLTGGLYLNAATGLFKTTDDISSYVHEIGKFVSGQTNPKYLEEARHLRVIGGDVTEGLTQESADDLLRSGLGGSATHGIAMQKAPGQWRTRDYFNPMKLGQSAGRKVEAINRVPLYAWLREHGYTAEAAAKEIAYRQFDYGRLLTPAERAVGRRLFPFYSWIKGSSGLTLKTLAQHPGGVMAQSLRAGEKGREESGYLPDWLGETAAVPYPGNPDRFLTNFGLPQDDVFSRVSFGATPKKSVQRIGEKLVSQMNPAVTLGYVATSGREPFFGRETRELYDYPTGDDLLNAILSKSPASRVLTTARTIGDERKGLGAKAINLFSPASVTDVSGGIERQKAISVAKAIEDVLDESPHVRRYERYYAPADEQEQLDPYAAQLLELADTLRQRARKEAQAR